MSLFPFSLLSVPKIKTKSLPDCHIVAYVSSFEMSCGLFWLDIESQIAARTDVVLRLEQSARCAFWGCVYTSTGEEG